MIVGMWQALSKYTWDNRSICSAVGAEILSLVSSEKAGFLGEVARERALAKMNSSPGM